MSQLSINDFYIYGLNEQSQSAFKSIVNSTSIIDGQNKDKK